ncbi:MAG: PepSY-associated TM helix domain-containing protein [Bryobacteraceae bacterium]|nr:PepSY-associated TM helix domain-containing protein [Bryobacteraceae bacterium]
MNGSQPLLTERTPSTPRAGGPARGPFFRALLWRQMRIWHWVSSALCLAGMLLFAFTGITLNHAGQIPSKPRVEVVDTVLPAAVLQQLRSGKPEELRRAAAWFRQRLGFAWDRAQIERHDGEWMASLPRPGGDAWLTVDLGTGLVHMEKSDRGWIAYLNDLHKGRHTGRAWSLFLDIFSVSCFIFCLTGLGLLFLHAPRRPATWPAVAAGLLIPALLAAWFIHR